MMDQIKMSKYSPYKKDSQKAQNHTTVVLNNKRDPQLEGGHYKKIGGMWTLKPETILPKLYEIIIKAELKGDNGIDLKKFYNHIKMCLNAVDILKEEFLPS